jgi:hypothetical protein
VPIVPQACYGICDKPSGNTLTSISRLRHNPGYSAHPERYVTHRYDSF